MVSLCQGSQRRPAGLHLGTDQFEFVLSEDQDHFCLFVEDVVISS